MTRFEHDPGSGAWYVRLRESEIEETIPLAEPGLGASVDVDRERYADEVKQGLHDKKKAKGKARKRTKPKADGGTDSMLGVGDGA